MHSVGADRARALRTCGAGRSGVCGVSWTHLWRRTRNPVQPSAGTRGRRLWRSSRGGGARKPQAGNASALTWSLKAGDLPFPPALPSPWERTLCLPEPAGPQALRAGLSGTGGWEQGRDGGKTRSLSS